MQRDDAKRELRDKTRRLLNEKVLAWPVTPLGEGVINP
tara:strand:- start:450 stop:563 length:114 start_codon:yes stop_codon:yes gene_type:complete